MAGEEKTQKMIKDAHLELKMVVGDTEGQGREW